jgi:hypothetical protein
MAVETVVKWDDEMADRLAVTMVSGTVGLWGVKKAVYSAAGMGATKAELKGSCWADGMAVMLVSTMVVKMVDRMGALTAGMKVDGKVDL